MKQYLIAGTILVSLLCLFTAGHYHTQITDYITAPTLDQLTDVTVTVKPEPCVVRLDAGLGQGEAFEILALFEKDQDYYIKLESYGGSSYDMAAIVNRLDTLQNRGYHITTETYGYAMSAGWMIFVMGDVRKAHADSIFMTHCNGMSSAYGGTRLTVRNPGSLPAFVIHTLEMLDAVAIRELKEIGLDDEMIEYLMYDEDYKFFKGEEAYRIGIVTELI